MTTAICKICRRPMNPVQALLSATLCGDCTRDLQEATTR